MELEWERGEGQRWKEGERVKCGRSSRPSWADETSEMGREGSVDRDEKSLGNGVAGGF